MKERKEERKKGKTRTHRARFLGDNHWQIELWIDGQHCSSQVVHSRDRKGALKIARSLKVW